MTPAGTDDAWQLSIAWSLLTRHYLPAVTQENALWEPSANVITVRADRGWRADWAEDDVEPAPDTTIAWLLWHVEWWWTDAVHGVVGRPGTDPQEFPWSGSVDASRATLGRLHDQWGELLTHTDPAQVCAAPWPTPQPFGTIAKWANMELMKNVAEIGLILRLYGNRPRPRR